MFPDNPKRARSWQEIAAEASREKDPKKLIQLAQELERALNEQYARPSPGPKGSGAGAA